MHSNCTWGRSRWICWGLETLKTKWAIPEKIQTGAWLREDIFFFEKETLEFLDLSLYQYSVQRKESFTCGNCEKVSDTPCLGNSIAKNQDLWKFHMIPPSLLFWIFSGIDHSRNQTGEGQGEGLRIWNFQGY